MTISPDKRSARRRLPVFTYRCTNCRTANKTNTPPEDCMLHCTRCGFLTVQAFSKVEGTPA